MVLGRTKLQVKFATVLLKLFRASENISEVLAKVNPSKIDEVSEAHQHLFVIRIVTYVFPAAQLVASGAVCVRNRVHASGHYSVLSRAQDHVVDPPKEVGLSVPRVEALQGSTGVDPSQHTEHGDLAQKTRPKMICQSPSPSGRL